MSSGTNADIPTTCPLCGTPYDFGSTGTRISDADAAQGDEPDPVDEAAAYCPNPGCPSHAESRVDDPGGA